MPQSVKITDLPPLSSVQPGDIVPIVPDPTVDGTQTSSATVAQIAAVGGGPPGDNTVTTPKLANGAVTAPKCGYTAADRVFYAGASQANGKYLGEEATLTAFGRSLIAAANGTSARALLNDSATFTGQIFAADGDNQLPAYSFTNSPSTGLYMSPAGWPSLSSYGVAVLAANRDEGLRTLPQGGTILLPAGAVRAVADFTTVAGSAGTYNNPFTVAYSFGLVNFRNTYGTTQSPSIADTTANRNRIIALEAARGNTVNAASFTNAAPAYDNRTNFLSCGDNVHYHWDGTAWVTQPACQNLWISGYQYTPTGAVTYNYINNVAGIVVTSSTAWTIHFGLPMPDNRYTVAVHSSTGVAVSIVNRSTTLFQLSAPSATGSINFSVSVLR